MKHIVSIVCLSVLLNLAAAAQESLPREEAQRIAKIVSRHSVEAGPVKFEANLDEPAGLNAGEGGLIVIPDAKLTRKALKQAGDGTISVGQLWMYKVALAPNNRILEKEKMRLVDVRDEGESATVQMYLLCAKKNDKGGHDLAVYAKAKDPVLTMSLDKIETDQGEPIQVQGRKKDDDSGVLTLNILGRYKAELTVMKHEGSD